MLRILKTVNKNGIDYILENGVELYEIDWNGEVYGHGVVNRKNVNRKNNEYMYKPVYRYEIDNINLNDLEENSDEWCRAYEIIGFEQIY